MAATETTLSGSSCPSLTSSLQLSSCTILFFCLNNFHAANTPPVGLPCSAQSILFQACSTVWHTNAQLCPRLAIPALLQQTRWCPAQPAWETFLLCTAVSCKLATKPCRCLQSFLGLRSNLMYILQKSSLPLFKQALRVAPLLAARLLTVSL